MKPYKKGTVLVSKRARDRRVRVVGREPGGLSGHYVIENVETGRQTNVRGTSLESDYVVDAHNTNRGRKITRAPASDAGRPVKALEAVIEELAHDTDPTVVRLAEVADVSVRTVYRYLDKLEAEDRLEVLIPEDARDPYRYRLKESA